MKETGTIYSTTLAVVAVICGWVLTMQHGAILRQFREALSVTAPPLQPLPEFAFRFYHWPFWVAAIAFGCFAAANVAPRTRGIVQHVAFVLMAVSLVVMALTVAGNVMLVDSVVQWQGSRIGR